MVRASRSYKDTQAEEVDVSRRVGGERSEEGERERERERFLTAPRRTAQPRYSVRMNLYSIFYRVFAYEPGTRRRRRTFSSPLLSQLVASSRERKARGQRGCVGECWNVLVFRVPRSPDFRAPRVICVKGILRARSGSRGSDTI